MKVIVLHKTKDGHGTVASVVGMKNYQVIAGTEIDALRNLLEKLEKKNPEWIIQPTHKTVDNLTTIPTPRGV